MTPDALLTDIIANPDDDTPRLHYAGWLHSHGQTDRADFIQAQCELARLPEESIRREELEVRSRALLRKHRTQWLEPCGEDAVTRWEFGRGFIEAGHLFASDLVNDAEVIFHAAPVQKVALECGSLVSNDPARLAACPYLSRLKELELKREGIGSE